MELFNEAFANKSLRIIDHSNVTSVFSETFNAQVSFAIEDAIATVVGQNLAPATVRLWVHEPTLVLGIPDSRLQALQDGVNYIRQLEYDVVIRNSGGLAVLLDSDVLNVSFILSNQEALSIDRGYDLMYEFTKQLFSPEGADISAYEIVGSYCPGDYDLSIGGKKFAGISQRRVRDGVAVQMYLDIAGSSYQRANIVKQFYQLAKGDEDYSFTYPEVNPDVMASINELLKTDFSVQDIIERIEKQFLNLVHGPFKRNLIEEERSIFRSRLKQMNKRNEIITC